MTRSIDILSSGLCQVEVCAKIQREVVLNTALLPIIPGYQLLPPVNVHISVMAIYFDVMW